MATQISGATTATNTTTASKPVDYIQTLNAGSGLNTAEIVNTLVNAEIVPKQTKINEQVEEKNVSISNLAQVKNDFTNFDTNLALLANQTGLIAASSSAAIEVTATEGNALKPFLNNFTVQNLAQAHTVAFGGFNSASATIPLGTGQTAGTLDFRIGSYSGDTFTEGSLTAQSIDITSNTTIQDLAGQINALSGLNLSASVIKTGDNAFSLMIKSATGASNQIKLTARNAAGATLSSVNFEAPASTDSAKQIAVGEDASFKIDNLTVTRATNTITDVVAGVTLELKQEIATNVEIGAAYDESMALQVLTSMVTEINTLREIMSNMIAMGNAGAEGGPLRGDMLIKSYVNRLKSITTTPIYNYQDDPIFLSNFGVMTELDGSLSIDTVKFSEYFKANPENFNALSQNSVISGDPLVQVSGTGSLYKSGTYDLNLTTTTVAGIPTVTAANLDGVNMVLENGVFKGDSSNTLGINVTAFSGAEDTKIYVGTSLIQSLRDFSKTVLTPGNAIDTKISNYNNEISDYEEELEKLETSMETIRARYTKQFTAMESAVASFKKTGEYLDNFMESWKAGLK